MAKIEIKTPALGESISEATIAKWLKKAGEAVKIDEPILELETEKVTLEIPSPSSGVLLSISKLEGENVSVGDILGVIDESATASNSNNANAFMDSKAMASNSCIVSSAAGISSTVSSAAGISSIGVENNNSEARIETKKISSLDKDLMTKEIIINLPPAVSRMVRENNLNPNEITGTGKHNQITKGDVINYIEGADNSQIQNAIHELGNNEKEIEKVKMSRLRKTIAARLKESQNTAAILTTFNEIDMQNVMNLRAKYKDEFEKNHKVKLGFMSFFVKATVNALKEIPTVNAEIEGDYLIYKNYYDIGVAVGTEQGLVVPVLRNCDKLSFAGIEKEIAEYGKKARDGKLSMPDMSGGTFTISNGGVYGSLLSTPIINPPQSGILGMHKIQERPVVINGKIEIRPMMYIALSYDHRIIDGKEAVTFLIRVKQAIEDPERLLLGL